MQTTVPDYLVWICHKHVIFFRSPISQDCLVSALGRRSRDPPRLGQLPFQTELAENMALLVNDARPFT
jgi:hypothetical protein